MSASVSSMDAAADTHVAGVTLAVQRSPPCSSLGCSGPLSLPPHRGPRHTLRTWAVPPVVEEQHAGRSPAHEGRRAALRGVRVHACGTLRSPSQPPALGDAGHGWCGG
eukprot:6720923-Lingulodinium_polyedra.AAC.2